MRYRLHSSQLAILVGSLLVLAIVSSLLVSAWIARKQEIEDWRTQLSNLSLILAEQTSQEVSAAYLVLDSIADGVHAAGIADSAQLRARMGSEAVFLSMRDKIRALPQIDVATVVDAGGNVINFTRAYPAPAINLGERDYFLAHLRQPGLGVFISAPVRNKANGQWTFYLSRRLNGPDGRFLGLALVGLSSGFLSEFYRKISLGEGAAISLYRRDFSLLASWPRADALMGQANRSGSSYTVIEQQKKTADVVVTSGPRFSQGGRPVLRMGAPRLLDKYPLIVNITVNEDLFLAEWRRFAGLLSLVAGASLVAIGIAFLLLVRTLRRREQDMELRDGLRLEAEKANRAKSEFLAMMSHEIRTPLTAIIGFAEMLGKQGASHLRVDAAAIIVRNGQHLLSIINNILDISKIEAGRMALEAVAFSPAEVLAGIEAMMGVQAASKGIALRCKLEYPLPALVVGDPTRWKQILFNLCSNAIKFTELGMVELTLWYDRAGARLVCDVVDTGVGIGDAEREQLFAPFAQGGTAVARKFGGTGLGLHLVQTLAVKMGGAVSVASVAGQGSVFEVWIRAEPAADSAWLDAAPAGGAPEAEPEAAPVASRLCGRVLLAEDGPDNRTLISVLLGALGLEIALAENGRMALEMALAGDYDAVLMDIQMPVMDGMRATELLRAAGYARPIVALTANVMDEDVRRYLSSGFSDCVGKPIDFKQLTQVLERYLGEAGRAAPAAPLSPAADQEIAALMRAFRDSLPQRIAQMQAQRAAGDWSALAAQAHMLKGSAGSFGHADLGRLAARIEAALAQGEQAVAGVALDALAVRAGAIETETWT